MHLNYSLRGEQRKEAETERGKGHLNLCRDAGHNQKGIFPGRACNGKQLVVRVSVCECVTVTHPTHAEGRTGEAAGGVRQESKAQRNFDKDNTSRGVFLECRRLRVQGAGSEQNSLIVLLTDLFFLPG